MRTAEDHRAAVAAWSASAPANDSDILTDEEKAAERRGEAAVIVSISRLSAVLEKIAA